MLETPRGEVPAFHCGAQRAAGFGVVAAVPETALPKIGAELDEGSLQCAGIEVSQPERLQTGTVDQPAFPARVKPGQGGGVASAAQCRGDFTDGRGGFGHEGVDERGFAHAGLADEQDTLALQPGFEHIRTEQGGQFDDWITERGKHGQTFTRGRQADGEIDLVERDERRDIFAFRRHEATRHEQIGKSRFGCDDDDNPAQVGGEPFLAEGVGAPQQIAARIPGFDDSQALTRRRDADFVAAGVIILFAPRVAAQDAADGADFKMAAKRGNDSPGGECPRIIERQGRGRTSGVCQICCLYVFGGRSRPARERVSSNRENGRIESTQNVITDNLLPDCLGRRGDS